MARPIPLELPRHDPRIELQTRLQDAPAEHAEALLAAYEVLQGLYDRGVFDLLRGALGSGDKVLEVGVMAAESPESIRTIRNLLLLVKMLGSIEPGVLAVFTQPIPQALRMAVQQPEQPGLWALIKDFLWNQDFRCGLAAVNTLLETFGRSLRNSSASMSKGSSAGTRAGM